MYSKKSCHQKYDLASRLRDSEFSGLDLDCWRLGRWIEDFCPSVLEGITDWIWPKVSRRETIVRA